MDNGRAYLSLLSLLALPLPLPAAALTFNQDIAPILFHSCAPCHRPGEAGPFSLLTYQDARKRASQIAAVTERRYMPPWPPEPGFGDFADSRRLTDRQVAIISAWVRQGAPEGDPSSQPPAPYFPDAWQLGPPDLVIQMPIPYTLPADGGDVFRNFVIPIHVDGIKYVRAVELRPGNKKIVHHANIVIDHGKTLRNRDGQDGQPGFPGMDVVTQSVGQFEPDSHFLFWKPGSVPHQEPADMGWRLDPDTDLILNMHLQPSGKPESIQPSLGVYFASQPPRRFPMLIQLEHDGALDIPAGDADFVVTDHLVLPADVELLGIYPHAHYLGKTIQAWAILPGGKRLWLIKIDGWDLNWQAVYQYRRPIALPKGTRLEMRIAYDNSGRNARNPNHPPQRVRAGNRSQDEMGHVWLQVLPASLALQEAVMTRRLEKYPADFTAHYNLGAALLSRGDARDSIPHFEAALRTKPTDAAARNSLGAALLSEDRFEDAARQLRETLRQDPDYLGAHYNLARALAATRDWAESASEYATYLAHKPDDAQAQVNLAGVYISQRRYDLAVPALRQAARLRPEDADIQINLGSTLAILGRYPLAIEAFERALQIEPGNAVATSNLANARAAGTPRAR